jgi:hypothetical protein
MGLTDLKGWEMWWFSSSLHNQEMLGSILGPAGNLQQVMEIHKQRITNFYLLTNTLISNISTVSQWILHSTCTQSPVHGYTHIHFITILLALQQCHNVKLIKIPSVLIFHKTVTMKLSNFIHQGFSSCLNLVSCKIFMFHLWFEQCTLVIQFNNHIVGKILGIVCCP